jgi:hypothetical protein
VLKIYKEAKMLNKKLLKMVSSLKGKFTIDYDIIRTKKKYKCYNYTGYGRTQIYKLSICPLNLLCRRKSHKIHENVEVLDANYVNRILKTNFTGLEISNFINAADKKYSPYRKELLKALGL